ncbi:hypothetical protein Hbl1158_05325 [Halobaculum sp. CBA1158]|uniref:formyltransferase family protein n=1 Tax=Halobaculum sp. CBA1158 TaxID=2904243 RepID=UPI001F46FEE6|nr:formyltransferase family protein [Halobaculum sp. CBA1158]UIP00780.1 hypothetical protein Hbl1158_05325 [Halobaculum sp. CBA1158]
MRVCLLAAGETLPRWQADALAHLLDHTDCEVTTVVYDEPESDRTRTETIRRALELREWAVVATLNDAVAGPIPHEEHVPLSSVVDRGAIRERSIDPRIVDGWKREIPAGVADAVAEEADVAVRFGFGFLVGAMLSAPEHGVVSFHHGDLREYRGQPMGFWEFVHGESTAGITVQRLSETLDGGEIAALKRVDIDDAPTWEAVKRRQFDASEDMLTRAVRAAERGDLREPASLGDLYSHPRGRPVATFAVRNAFGRLREVFGTADGDTPARLGESELR